MSIPAVVRDQRAVPFAAWVLVGAVCAFGVASLLTVGLFVLPFGLLLAVILGRLRGWRSGWPGAIAGAAIVPFYIGYLNRGGPGEVCRSSDAGTSCVQEWSPLPFVIVGLVMLAASAVLAVARGRRAIVAG